MPRTAETKSKLQALHKALHATREEIVNVLRAEGPEPIRDYILAGPSGPVPLSSVFGEQDDLLVIHNMGSSCPYCTMWADGFEGLRKHLENRAALIVVSPDTPEQQAQFAARRGWGFRMLSNADSGFTAALGFEYEDGGRTYQMPGYSTLRRQPDGSIVRIAHDMFGPGDVYNAGWHMFPLLADGVAGWQPKFSYA
ncbi:MAG: DUF899 family protein [Planctomycetota bacterium]|nr:DUF899 family protein [Planctomycetota bacterium]